MARTIEKIPIRRKSPPHNGGRDFPGGGDDGKGEPPLPVEQLGMGLFLAAVTMLFIGLTSAYLVRRGGSDWQAIRLPPLLWFNTSVLLLSSGTMYWAQRAIRRDQLRTLRRWLAGTMGLGLLFLLGQWRAWRQLATQGIYLSTNPSSSFFYVLTGAHALHLLGGLLLLLYVLVQAWRGLYSARRRIPVEVCGMYWHFLDGLWLYLFFFLFLFRD